MKSVRFLGIVLLAAMSFLTVKAQKAMNPQDLEAWKRITTRTISNDGQWAAAMFSPWKGDSEVQLLSVDGKAVYSYSPASEVKFSSSAAYALVKKVPADALMDELKLKKTKKDKMPMEARTSGFHPRKPPPMTSPCEYADKPTTPLLRPTCSPSTSRCSIRYRSSSGG